MTLAFDISAWIGKAMTETFYRRTGKKLGAKIRRFTGQVDMEWAEVQKGRDRTLVFFHGFSDRKENFYIPGRHLCQTCNLILPDMPGFGQSTTDPGLTYSLSNYARWMCEFVDRLDTGPVHLAGNSLGGAIAARVAIERPDRIRSLSLVDTAGFFLEGQPGIYDEALAGINIFRINTWDQYQALQERVFRRPPVLPPFVKSYMLKTCQANNGWYKKIFEELADLDQVRAGHQTLEALSLNQAAQTLRMPVRAFWGRHDTLFPWQTARLIRDTIPNASAHIFDHLGHIPQMEDPKGFARALEAFLDTV